MSDDEDKAAGSGQFPVLSRREFLGAAAPAAAFTILPASVLGRSERTAPNDRVTVACIGVGAQGTRVMLDFLKQPDVQVVAVCDVNEGSNNFVEWGANELRDKVRTLLGDPAWGPGVAGCVAGREPARRIVDGYYARPERSGQYAGCAAYVDFRELLEKQPDLDAVIIGTPDHAHAVIAIAAMKKGKHVYCQKPLTHSVEEARRIAEVAKETKVATQVATGNQASEATRQLCEWIWAGAIGPVRQVVNWSDRPYWPQGMDRPPGQEPVPPGLNWDLWLGPAPARPFLDVYQPFVWRGWTDFGTGALGDMGCYSFDTIFRVLKLGPPTRVQASATKGHPETFPQASIVHFDFPARGSMPPVRLTWSDAGLKPPRPVDLPAETGLDKDGLLFIGDRGTILCGFNGARPRLIPEARMKAFKPPAPTLPRSPGHDREWIDACKGGPAPGANFAFAGLVTESLLLGNVALRAEKELEWDGAAHRITNVADANALLRDRYRDGWGV
jgi:predicted dehydrogenase